MSKVVLFAASLMLVAGIASAGIIDPCNSPVTFNGTQPVCYAACPQGDTQSFLNSGFSWSYVINDLLGQPIADIPGTDFWQVDCDPSLSITLCAGSASCAADSATNDNGRTTMGDGTLSAGGCADGLTPVVQGLKLGTPPGPTCADYCFNVWVRSPDMNGDLLINIQDLAAFAANFPPNPYGKCADMDCNFVVNIQDLAFFAFHFGPPGHECN